MPEPSPILFARVRKIVAAHAGSLRAIEPETRLHEDLGLDWIHLVAISSDLEDELHVAIPDCELSDHLMTVADVVMLAELAIAASAAVVVHGPSGSRPGHARGAA